MILSRCHRVKPLFRVFSASHMPYNSNSTSTSQKIVIPKRIPREPTDILNALSSTVGKDPTAPHFKYHDDPFLIPLSNIGKRTFALAQESGRKAAQWVKKQHGNVFNNTAAEPPIKAFMPPMVFTENSEVTITSLEGLIEQCEITDAMLVYSMLKKNAEDVSIETKQSLLELICFYNHEDTLEEQWIEERWFRQSTSGKDRQRKTWKDAAMAEELFGEIEPKDARTYGAIVRGMCKYFQVDRAWALFEEARAKDLPLDINTYNAILQVTSFLKESGEMRWQFVQEILTSIAKEKMCPNIGTLNAVLQTLTSFGGVQHGRSKALAILSEFDKIGVEPSLGSWYYMLTIFCRDRGPVSNILVDILNRIEKREFHIQDIKDTYFFVTAMDVCRNHLLDKDLARRVDAMLHTGNNYDLIGDSFKESIYYRHYFALLCATEPLDTFMETYYRLVPNVYIPEPGVMEEILKAVDTNGALEYIPELWSHMVIFDHTNRESLLWMTLKIMVDNQPNASVATHADLNERFVKIAWDIWTKIEEQPENRTQQLTWTGQMLGDILTLCCRAGDFEKAQVIFQRIDKGQQSFSGAPNPNALESFSQLCIDNKQPSKSIACIQYCVENGYTESSAIGIHLVKSMTLAEHHLSKLQSLIGSDTIQDLIAPKATK